MMKRYVLKYWDYLDYRQNKPYHCQNFGRISYVFTKFGNKLNVDIFLTTLSKNGMVEENNPIV